MQNVGVLFCFVLSDKDWEGFAADDSAVSYGIWHRKVTARAEMARRGDSVLRLAGIVWHRGRLEHENVRLGLLVQKYFIGTISIASRLFSIMQLCLPMFPL